MFREHRYDDAVITYTYSDMSPLNKFEAIGIFGSVAVMALALALLRLETAPSAVLSLEDSASQQASLVVAGDEDTTVISSIERTLTNAVTANGSLTDLVIDDVRIGSGPEVVQGDTVAVHYIGTLRDGTQFDSSYARGEPFSFTVGDGRVIRGWEEGLIGMRVGGQRVLVIPPQMAYGNVQVGPIPPNSPLVFAIELLEIR